MFAVEVRLSSINITRDDLLLVARSEQTSQYTRQKAKMKPTLPSVDIAWWPVTRLGIASLGMSM